MLYKGMSKFSEVLRNHNFFLLWLGQIVSQLGDRLGQMAMIAFVSLRGGNSTLEIAKILTITILPVFIIGPFAGVYVDRWDRRRTLYISDFLRALLVVLIPLYFFSWISYIPVYITIFLVFCIGRFFIPAKLSIVPELVRKEDLLLANSLVNITGMIAAVLGFGITGILVEWVGAKSGLNWDALSFLISAILIFFIRQKAAQKVKLSRVGKDIVEMIRKSVAREFAEGLVYCFKNKDIRFAAWILFLLSSAFGLVCIVLITFVQKSFHSVTKDFGLLGMMMGIGLFVGSLVYGRWGQRFSRYKIIFCSLIIDGILLAGFSLLIARFPDFILASILSFGMGFFVAPIIIAVNTTVHHVSENGMMGKVFSSFEVVMHAGFLLFMFISGMLTRIISADVILVAGGSVFVVLGVINLIFHRALPWLE